MPRTRSLAFAELKIGIVTIFALTMAALLIFAVGGSAGFWWQRYPLKTIFSDVATLQGGSPVRVAGVQVGSVTDVKLTPSAVEVWFEVSKDVQPLVTTELQPGPRPLGQVSQQIADLLVSGAVPVGHVLSCADYCPVAGRPAASSNTSCSTIV